LEKAKNLEGLQILTEAAFLIDKKKKKKIAGVATREEDEDRRHYLDPNAHFCRSFVGFPNRGTGCCRRACSDGGHSADAVSVNFHWTYLTKIWAYFPSFDDPRMTRDLELGIRQMDRTREV